MQSRGSCDLNATASREFLRDGLAASGAIHGHERCIRADVCCTSSKSTCRETERERERRVTRERFGMFIFFENTRPSLGTRGIGRRGLDRGTDIA